MALFPEAGSDGRTLLLDDRPLIGDSFGGSHVANELLDCILISLERLRD